MQIVLETDRLRLRRFTADDIDLLVDLDSDPGVKRYIDGGKATPREEVETVVLPRILSYYERFDSYGYWAAEEKSSGEFVGWFALHPNEDSPHSGGRRRVRDHSGRLGTLRSRLHAWSNIHSRRPAAAPDRSPATDQAAPQIPPASQPASAPPKTQPDASENHTRPQLGLRL
jgi:hypothetical protein